MVSYQQTKDLSASAQMTFLNMRSYYEQYSVEWDCLKIEEQIHDLTNLDIILKGKTQMILIMVSICLMAENTLTATNSQLQYAKS